jgi:glutamate 5-kinase
MATPRAASAQIGAPEQAMGEAEERRHLRYAKRVIIKIGTPVVTHSDGAIAIARISGIVEQIVQLVKRGKEVVIVTSGAIGHGLLRMQAQAMLSSSLRAHLSGQAGVNRDIDLKAAAAVGQTGLMSMYDMLFREYNMTCAQILVTEEDWLDAGALSQLRYTTAELLSIGAIPIVNENDALSMRSLPVLGTANKVMWDNDEIAALLASALHADALLVLADFDQLYALDADGAAAPLRAFDKAARLCHRDETAAGADAGAAPPYESRIAMGGFDVMVAAAEHAVSHVRRPRAARARAPRASYPSPAAVPAARAPRPRARRVRRACARPSSSPGSSRPTSAR